MAEEKPKPIVTIDTWSGRQTVNIGRLLDTDEGRAYRSDMARVPTIYKTVSGSVAAQPARKKK